MIDKFGLYKGTLLYFKIKTNRLSGIKIPGISHPFSLRKNSSDTAVFDQVFLRDDYNINLSFSPSVIIDAGANIGLFTVFMKSRFPDAKFICLEPDEENCAILKEHIAAYNDVTVLHAGLWSSDTKLKVVDKYQMGKSALTVEEDKLEGNTTGISMDTLMQNYSIEKIDILKIDIETSESELFSKNYEQWLPKTKMIIIELHDFLKPGCSRPFFEAIHKIYSNYSYHVYKENTIIENNDLL